MRENGPIVVLAAALLTLLGIRSLSPDGAAPSKSEPKSGQAAASESGGKERSEVGGEAPSDEETLGPAWPALDFQNTRNVKDQNAQCLDVPGWESRYLIACVPDPQDSSSGYRFDSLIDAIQRAAETQHFVLDRYYYPWSHNKPSFDVDVQGALIETRSGKREAHFAARSKPTEGPGRTDPQQWPGLLLFRGPPRDCSASSRPQLLQIFLVGETATAGIHKQAFTASLDRIAKSDEYKKDPTVRILGPDFSGSQASLEWTLKAWFFPVFSASIVGLLAPPAGRECLLAASAPMSGRMPTFKIISGYAKAIDKDKLEKSCRPAQVKFHAAIIPDREVFKATLHYLGVADYDSCGRFTFKERIALLGESNTTFGADTTFEVGATFEVDTKKELLKPKNNEPAYFPFPLRISEVRSAYQQKSGPIKNDILNLPSFGSKLHLPLASGQPRDTEPSLDPAMSAVTTERVLGTMLNTIAQERFPYTLIVATDVKDQLFLATLLRQHCPETRLILSGNDLLFSHPDVSAALRGTIVGSTYPLYPRNQHWRVWRVPGCDAEHRHIIFPSEEAQGYYNATVALLNPDVPNALLGYGPPFPRLPRAEPTDWRRPPVWVNIVGQGGVFPLAAIPLKPCSRSADYVLPRPLGAAGEGAFQPFHPALWIILVLVITFLLVYVFSAYFAADAKSSWEMRKLFCPWQGALGAGRLLWRQRLYTFSCLTSVFVLYAYLTFVWLIPFYYRCVYGEEIVKMQEWSWIWIVPIVLVPLLLPIAAALIVFPMIPSSWFTSILGWRSRTSFCERFISLMLGALFSLLLLFVLIYHVASAKPVERLLFFDRATSLTSGVSPVVPVFFLSMAFFCWGYVQLKRLYLLGPTSAQDNPFPKMAYFEQVNKHHDELKDKYLPSPEHAVWKSWGAAVVGLALLFSFLRIGFHRVPSVGEGWTDWHLFAGLAVLAVLIGYGWLHLCKVWKSTRELLGAIARLPKSLEDAFERIPTAITDMFGPYLSTTRPGRGEQLQARQERLTQLAQEYQSVKGHLPSPLGWHMASAPQKMKVPAAASDSKPDLCNIAQTCFTLMALVWSNAALAERFTEPPLPNPSASDKLVRNWLMRVQDFIALEVTVYLSQFFVHLRNLILFLTIAPILMLAAVASYPFQPQRAMLFLAATLVAVGTATVIWIIQIERNEVLNLILRTTSNKRDFPWHFRGQILLYAAPLLGVVVTASSVASDLVHALVDPLIQALR